jgi:hypothetical protein
MQGGRQTHNEVHIDVFPFSLGNAQGLEVSGRSQMIGIDSSTGITFGYILHYLSLHSRPPEILLQILIHLVGSRMNRISRAMSRIHDLAAKFKVLQNQKAVLEP